MELELISLEELRFEKVAYYSAQIVGYEFSEFHDFTMRMKKVKKDATQLSEINRFIQLIGTTYGAREQYFKREGSAERLPPAKFRFIDSDGETDFGLRLYCIRISESIVILLNGDRKTAQKIKDCPNCFPHFTLANKLSDAIYEATVQDKIEFDGMDILIDDDFTLIIPD